MRTNLIKPKNISEAKSKTSVWIWTLRRLKRIQERGW